MLVRAYLFLLIFLVAALAVADPENSPSATVNPGLATRIESLKTIDESINLLESNLRAKQKLLRSKDAHGREAEINADIQKISEDLNNRESSFRQLVADVDTGELGGAASDQAFSLLAELEKLIRPLVARLQEITALPREIESLRAAITQQTEQLELLRTAAINSAELVDQVSPESELYARLVDARDHWQEQAKSVETNLAILKQRLNSRLDQQVPLGQSLGNVFEVFFKSRGKNLLLAIGAAALFFLLLRRLFNLSQRSPRLRQIRYSTYNRVILLVYMLSSALGTGMIFLLVLYLTDDWLLLTIALLVVLGLVWASRETLPRFWSQLLLLLNMGPVREGELVTYQGLPWKIAKLHLFTQLINPALRGGTLKVPVIDLINLRSREIAAGEDLFPSKEGDWILFNDNSHGQITLQTPTQVQITELGGKISTIRTDEFIKEIVVNISSGFRISSSFGLDYRHKPDITTTIPDKLKTYITEHLSAAGYDIELIKTTVEFEAAGRSSLNLAVICDFPGGYARDYNKLQRLIQKLCVDACNENNWTIPFDQLTVHMQAN